MCPARLTVMPHSFKKREMLKSILPLPFNQFFVLSIDGRGPWITWKCDCCKFRVFSIKFIKDASLRAFFAYVIVNIDADINWSSAQILIDNRVPIGELKMSCRAL